MTPANPRGSDGDALRTKWCSPQPYDVLFDSATDTVSPHTDNGNCHLRYANTIGTIGCVATSRCNKPPINAYGPGWLYSFATLG